MRRGTRKPLRIGALLGAGALLFAATGCRDGGGITGLGETFDPAATVRLLEDVTAAGEENTAAAHVSLAATVLAPADEPEVALGSRAPGGLVERMVRGSAGADGEGDGPPGGAGGVRLSLGSLGIGGPGAPIGRLEAAAAAARRASPIPDTLEGTTFALQGIGGYQPVAGETDAPSDGVRFLTYELDPLTRRPKRVPLGRVGHLDIRDIPSGVLPRLELHGVRGTGSGATTELDTFLEGLVSFSDTELSSDLSSAGSLLDGKRRVEFALDERIALTEGFGRLEIALSRRIDIPAAGRSVALEWEGIATAGEGGAASVTFTLRIADGDHAAVLDVTATDVFVEGTLLYDGQTVAVLSGVPFDPTFSRPDGSPFPAAELDALRELLEGTDEVLLFGDEMFSSLAILLQA